MTPEEVNKLASGSQEAVVTLLSNVMNDVKKTTDGKIKMNEYTCQVTIDEQNSRLVNSVTITQK